MISNSSAKSLALHRQQLGERGAAALLVVGEDHLAHGDDAVAVEEHMLGAAEADAFGAEAARDARVGRRLGIGAHLHAPHLVGPFHDRGEFAGEFGLAHGDRAFEHLAGRAVDGDRRRPSSASGPAAITSAPA